MLDNGTNAFLGLLGTWIPQDEDTDSKARLSVASRVWRALEIRPQFVLLYAILEIVVLSYLGLALVGLSGRAAPERWPLGIVLVAIVYLVLVCGGPFGSHRMRVPVMPLAAVLAGSGVCRLRSILAAHRTQPAKATS
jgi:hypothetical protein